ncbi:MAG: HAMP domain-containing histidine kinase [Acidimicrobiia bacterium]|nr:HAMP domain-containing histidine kinase [Acidimicrobiia bacterium]MBP8179634.1 HAMP domain-containing histidine kinase [Acidimicrobiia bacterium]
MRRQLVLIGTTAAVAVTVAFLIPLLLAARSTAFDRSVAEAEREAIGVALEAIEAITTQGLFEVPFVQLEGPLSAIVVDHGAERTSIILPSQRIGAAITNQETLVAARAGENFTAKVGQDRRVVVSLRVPGSTEYVSGAILVSRESLWSGVGGAFAIITVIAVVALAFGVLLLDRLAVSVAGPVQSLAAAAHRVGLGDLDVRVEEKGPVEIAETAAVFNKMTERIGHLLVAERELVADLSHRLRTPLTALNIDIECVEDDDTRARLLEDVGHVESTLTEVIREARSATRTDAPEVSDLGEVIAERLSFWEPLAEDQERPWAHRVESDLPYVAIPRGDLVALLDALIGNVFAHTPEGCGYGVAVRLVNDRSQIRLIVTDQGPGFDDPASALERGVSGGDSTGLGLDIVKRTAEHANGSVNVGNRAGGGGRVEVILPATNTDVQPVRKRPIR